MLSSEFTQELGALIRRLETRVRLDPVLQHENVEGVQKDIEDAIVTLCAVHIRLGRIANDL